MSGEFQYDVFLSHSAKDKAVVRPLAERLRQDGLTPNAKGRRLNDKVELQPSPHAFGSDWAQLACLAVAIERRRKAGPCGRGNLPFRDPLNQERRFVSGLQPFTDAPIKGSLAHFLYINWLAAGREQEYAKLLEACRPPANPPAPLGADWAWRVRKTTLFCDPSNARRLQLKSGCNIMQEPQTLLS